MAKFAEGLSIAELERRIQDIPKHMGTDRNDPQFVILSGLLDRYYHKFLEVAEKQKLPKKKINSVTNIYRRAYGEEIPVGYDLDRLFSYKNRSA